MTEKKYRAIGLMSGSSLDGLDIAYCEFTMSEAQKITDWELLEVETIPFSKEWIEKLKNAPSLSGKEIAKLDTALGRYFGVQSLIFIGKHKLEPQFISSHGHTIFHYPNEEFTLQIGSGAAIAAITGYPVMDNFRAQDVALGGQGAPLAPIVDYYLFEEYDICLNLGGIANLTAKTDAGYVAFDIGGANQVLNALVNPLGWPYDDGGCFAAAGELKKELLEQVDLLKYFHQPFPKSLGNDWVREELFPIYEKYDCPIEDKLHTACVQLGNQMAKDLTPILKKNKSYKLLATGGGALNDFLIECITTATNKVGDLKVEIPDPKIIEYKEALLMALLGVLRLENVSTTFTSVTGARESTIGGALHQGWKVEV